MESGEYFWAGIGITLLLLPIIQWWCCFAARENVEEDTKTGRLHLDKEDIGAAIELKFLHPIIGVPVFVGVTFHVMDPGGFQLM